MNNYKFLKIDTDPCQFNNGGCGPNAECKLDYTICGNRCRPSNAFTLNKQKVASIWINLILILTGQTTTPSTTTPKECPCYYSGPSCQICNVYKIKFEALSNSWQCLKFCFNK